MSEKHLMPQNFASDPNQVLDILEEAIRGDITALPLTHTGPYYELWVDTEDAANQQFASPN